MRNSGRFLKNFRHAAAALGATTALCMSGVAVTGAVAPSAGAAQQKISASALSALKAKLHPTNTGAPKSLKKIASQQQRVAQHIRHGAKAAPLSEFRPLTAMPTTTTFLETLVVTTTHDRSGASYNTCVANAATTCSLRAALEEVRSLETSTDPTNLAVKVTVPTGTYDLSYLYTTHLSELQVEAPYGVVISGAGETQTKIVADSTANYPDRVMVVGEGDTSSVTLRTLTLSTGWAPALFQTTGSSTTCISTYASSGGDLAVCNNYTTLTLNKVRLEHGRAVGGAGVAALNIHANSWIVDSTISDNDASLTYTATITKTYTTFAYGGGALVTGSLSLIDTDITHNGASSSGTSGVAGGGIVATGHSLFTGGSISTNSAISSSSGTTTGGATGGGADLNGVVQIHGTTFVNDNAVSTFTDAAGGAIVNGGWLQLVSTVLFQSNVAIAPIALGGAIWTGTGPYAGDLRYTNDSFVTNIATAHTQTAFGGAVAITSGGHGSPCSGGMSFTSVTLQNNLATANSATGAAAGGGLYIQSSTTSCTRNTIELDNSTVSTNVASSVAGSTGGGIRISVGNEEVKIFHSSISHNKATNSSSTASSNGGGTDITTKSNILFQTDALNNNVVTAPHEAYGGAVFNYTPREIVYKNVLMSGNVSASVGGAMDTEPGYETITSSTIADNTVLAKNTGYNGGGGGVLVSTSLTVSNSTFANNVVDMPATASYSSTGGAMTVVSLSFTLHFDTITGNKSAFAPVHLVGVASGSVSGSVIAGNTNLSTATGDKYLNKPTNCGGNFTLRNAGGNYIGISVKATTQQACVASPVGADGTDPMLAPLSNNGGGVLTMVPEVGSPLLKAGGTTCPGFDEIGQTRPSSNCTIGAFQETVGDGYTLVASDGGVFAFPTPLFHGSTGSLKLNQPVVAMASTPDGLGYWLAAADGGIFNFGNAGFFGSLPGIDVKVSDIVGIASTPDGLGYWMVGANGAVNAFGDATSEGSLPGTGVTTSNIVGIAAHGSDGYWLVGSNGAVYAFGSARYQGGANTLTLNAKIVGIAADPTGEGYWLVGSDGGVFGYGSAHTKYFGSMGGQHLNKPVVGITATADGEGYWLVASDGGVFNYGDATFLGSTGSLVLNKPMVGMS